METVASVGRGWYNYYHQKSRVETKDGKAEENWYDRDLSKEEISASNTGTLNRESYGADACRKLHEIYADNAARNRALYSDVREMRSAVNQKYMFGKEYQSYSRDEREAMADNEIHMTEFGSLSYGQSIRMDPHLKGPIAITTTDTPSFNTKMLNYQIANVLKKNSIELSELGNTRFSFTVNGMTKKLDISVLSGNADSELLQKMTDALNSGNNARNLFYNLLYDGSRKGTHKQNELTKWALWDNFKTVTGLDIRSFQQTNAGFIDKEGRNAQDIFRDALEHTNTVPSEFKDAALEYFQTQVDKALQYNLGETPDMQLSMSFEAGQASLGNDGINILA